MNPTKIIQEKRIIASVLVVYMLSYLMQLVFPVVTYYAQAETALEETHLVAVIVDEELYANNLVKNDIERYATDYIQQNMGGTKALVIPVNTKKLKARDIVAMLENLYFEGEKDATSTLDGVILIGDKVPLPVVNDEGFVSPTVFPYTDFIEQRYIWDKETGYFVVNDREKSEPELWHGLLFFGEDPADYTRYFDKLQEYVAMGDEYIGSNFWYDDFRAYAETFNGDVLGYYLNKFLFAEDLNYKRFHQLIFELFNNDHNDSVAELFTEIQVESGSTNAASVGAFNAAMSGQSLPTDSGVQNVPARLIESSLTNFFKGYKSLMGSSYLETMRDNVLAGGRRTIDDIDTHSDMMEQMDALYVSSKNTNTVLMQFNKTLQDALVKEVKENEYSMHIPLLVHYRDERNQIAPVTGNIDCWQPWFYLKGEYENFYFGKNAFDVQSVQDLSYYRGEFQNFKSLDQLEQYDYTQSGDLDYLKNKSVGGSYNIFSQQIEANRGYDFTLTQRDIDDQQVQKDNETDTACVDMEAYVNGFRGGNTPINLDQNASGELELKSSDFTKAWNPTFDRNIGGPLYDIAGARNTAVAQPAAYDRASMSQYAFLQRVKWNLFAPQNLNIPTTGVAAFLASLLPIVPIETNLKACDINVRESLTYDDYDYFAILSGLSADVGYYKTVELITGNKAGNTVLPIVVASDVVEQVCPVSGPFSLGGSYRQKETFQYKTIDSVVVHDAPNAEQYNGMSQFTTLDAPINSLRYMTFQSLDGDTVKLGFPNMYHVPVYTETADGLVLKSVSEIEAAIDSYLTGLVVEYNQKLLAALQGRNANYSARTDAYDFLSQLDPLATPNRGYQLLDENFFRNLMPQELKEEFAQILHFQNSPWKTRPVATNVVDDIDAIKNSADINAKVKQVFTDYLTYDPEPPVLARPGYKKDGYEVAYLNSDGGDYLIYDEIPLIVQNIGNQQTQYAMDADAAQEDDRGDNERKCGIGREGRVDIIAADGEINWFQALECWLEETKASPLKFEVTFKNAQGPVLVLDQFKNILNDYSKPVLSGAHESLETYKIERIQALENLKSNEALLDTLTGSQQQSMQEVMTYVLPRASSDVFFLEPVAGQIQNQFIQIGASKDVGEITLRITTSGENCLRIDGQNVCNEAHEMVLNPYTSEQVVEVDLQGTKAGIMNINYEMCSGSLCVSKSERVVVAPGNVDDITIDFPYSRVILGAEMPVSITAKDQFGNPIAEQINRYRARVSRGTLNTAGREFEFTNFQRGNVIFSSEEQNDKGSVTLTVEPVDTTLGLPSKTATFNVVDGKLVVLSGNQQVTNIEYTLPDTFNAIRYTDVGDVQNVRTTAIPKITLDLSDLQGNPLTAVAALQVKNGIVEPGVFDTQYRETRIGGQDTIVPVNAFQQKSTIVIQNGQAELYLFPKMKNGEDELMITIPGREPIVIPIVINPGSPKIVEASSDTSVMKIGQTAPINLIVTDIWGNLIPGQTSLNVRALGSIAYTGAQTVQATDGRTRVQVQGVEPGGRGYATIMIDGVQAAQQRPGLTTFMVQNNFIPTENLNIMYLNLFGSDRANLWGYFSQNENVASEMIAQSPKMLAVTTQLIDPTKLHKFVATVNAKGVLQSTELANQTLVMASNKLFVQHALQPYQISLGDVSDYTLTQKQTIAGTTEDVSTPTLMYVPSIPDASFTENIVQGDTVRINGQTVFDLDTASSSLSIRASDRFVGGRNVWEVRLQGVKVAELVVARPSGDTAIVDDIETAVYGEDYGITVHFGEGSTNGEQAVGIYSHTEVAEPDGYESIEASVDYTTHVGFRHPFQNISAFAGGSSVGEATRGFASPWLINIGDPLLTRVSKNEAKNDTDFDPGIGEVIHTSADNDILKTIYGDLNADNLVDLITIHQDGRVKWIKNYSADNAMHNIGDLMYIAERIDEARLGDVDGNGYNDIIVRTLDDKLRVYKNDAMVFDVDGYPVCLDHGFEPDSLAGVEQVFLEDMDNDNAVDIVLNTHNGEVMIVYGGTTQSGNNYVSSSPLGCDASWQQRQQPNRKVVKQYGTEIRDELKVVDNSVVRRAGLTDADELADITNQSAVAGSLPALNGQGQLDFTSFDPSGMIENGADSILRWTVSPVQQLPIYENLDFEEIRYLALSQINPDDEVDAYKIYEDLNGGLVQSGDIVKITVHIEGNTNKRLTYIDQLKGPWIVDVDATSRVTSFSSGSLNQDARYVSLPGSDYLFMVDNMLMPSNGDLIFSYTVTYNGGPMVRIALEDVNKDNFTDIQVYPIDGCVQYRWDQINTNQASLQFRDYEETENDLGSTLQGYVDQQEQGTQNHIGGFSNTVGDVVDNQDLQGLQDVTSLGNQWSFDTMFDSFLRDDGQINLGNIELNLFEDQMADVNGVIDDVLGGLCKGFSLGEDSCAGLPVPFNMSFLSPGSFNIFGCKPNFPTINRIFPDDKGFPVFWFPGTMQTPAGPIPFPWGPQMLSQVDDFGYGFPSEGGTYPSMVRIYVSPTLTMKLGLAVCFGPQAGFNNLPSPIRDIGGNCVVLSIPMPLACGDGEDDAIGSDLFEAVQGGACPQPPIQPSGPGDKSSSALSLTVAEPGVSPQPPIANGTYFGMVQFDAQPIMRTNKELEGVELKPGDAIELKIQGGMMAVKGIVKCLVNDWIDRQLRYILNNLTNMTVGIYLPDLTDLAKGFDTLTVQDFKNRMDSLQKVQDKINKSDGYDTKNVISNEAADTKRAVWLQKGQLQELSDGASNPFDAISTMFENVPLVNINTRDINITIPMIYSDDIRAYTTYLTSWLEENRQNLLQWEGLLQGVFGVCGQQLSIDQIKKGIQGTGAMPDPSIGLREQIANMQTTVVDKYNNNKSELKSLQACKTALENGDVSTCTEKTVSDIDKSLSRLSNAASVDNECMSFVFGNSVNGGFNTNVVNPSLTNFISFQENSALVMKDVRQNLRVLELYRQFPLELYEWVHIVDRYLSEMSAMIDSFLGSLMFWLQQNTSRFEKWVDAIIVLIGVIKSWQAIVDLSVNWSKTCSKCTQDNYDNYACSLSFLCVELPVLPIPPFKVPSIFLDFSHIDLGIDILLPEFNFVPTKVKLPDLPKLPTPPQVQLDINFDFNLPPVEWKNEIKFFAEFMLNLNRGLDLGSLSIPRIPILPQPPQLPPLPSVLPTFEIVLPLLPPAPKIPNLSPAITTTIKVVETVAKIYCIIKGGIGLVGEQGIKTRIEQMTQRTYDVPIFDDMDLTQFSRDNPLQGFDWKIDAFVNFNFNFVYLYDLLQGFADVANNAMNEFVIDPVNEGIDQFNEKQREVTKEFEDFGGQNIDVNLNIPIGNSTGNTSYLDWNNITQHPEGIELYEYNTEVAYEEVYKKLRDGLQKLAESDLGRTGTFKGRKIMAEAITLLDTDPNVSPNIEGIQNINDNVQGIFTDKQKYLADLGQKITSNYDGFLQSIDNKATVLVEEKTPELRYEANLFNVDATIKETLANQEHPMRSYLNLQKEQVDGFANALQKNTPKSLNMTYDQHEKIQAHGRYLKSGIDVLLGVLDKEVDEVDELQQKLADAENEKQKRTPVVASSTYFEAAAQSRLCPSPLADPTASTENQVEETKDLLSLNDFKPISYVPSYQDFTAKELYAQVGTTTATQPSESSIMKYLDFASYLDGIYVKADQRYVNVVQSSYHAKAVDKNYRHVDINNSGTGDIMMRTADSIYVKYDQQDNIVGPDNAVTYHNDFYEFDTIDSREDLASRTVNTDGYLTVNGEEFKFFMLHHEVKNFAVTEQTSEGVSYQWKNSLFQNDNVDGYLIKLHLRSDLKHTKEETANFLDADQQLVQYILMLPDGRSTENARIVVPGDLALADIEDYMTGTIVKVGNYLEENEIISYAMTEMPRRWYYSQIISLQNIASDESPVYAKRAPWSQQILGGQQIIADDLPPLPTISLYRQQTDEVIDEGNDLNGFINTRYDLRIEWEDNVEVMSNTVQQSGGISVANSGATTILTGLFFDDIIKHQYTISAVDANDNLASDQVTLTINVPNLDILTVDEVLDGKNVISQLSQDLDEGNVRFERNRYGSRERIEGFTGGSLAELFPITVNQTIVTGGVFQDGEFIEFKDANNELLATLDPDTGEIKIQPAYIGEISLDVDFKQHIPIVHIRNSSQISIFAIYLKPKQLAETNPITLLDGSYSTVELTQSHFGDFVGGFCIQNASQECELYVGPTGVIYTPEPYHTSYTAEYSYDENTQNVAYTIKTLEGTDLAKVQFQVEPIVQE